MEKLGDYLGEKYQASTARRYLRDILLYLQAVGEGQAQKARLSDVVNYLGQLREQGKSSADIACHLQGIKKYYYWLLHSHQREDHPCAELVLKDRPGREVIFADLLRREELESLLDRKERYRLAKRRNQIILTLLIYQALTVGNLVQLRIKDLDLAAGTIYIKVSNRLNARRLLLRPSQILLLDRYVSQDRPALLSGEPSEALLVNQRGRAIQGEDISYLLETYRSRFPGRKIHAKLIRMSVLACLLEEGRDLREVQLLAGHKYPSSTERYRQARVSSLQSALEKYHPLS